MSLFKHFIFRMTLLAAFAFACFTQAQGQELKAAHAGGEILIKYKPSIAALQVQTSLDRAGLKVLHRFEAIGVLHCEIPAGARLLNVLEMCRNDADVLYAEPNYTYHTFEMNPEPLPLRPDDPRFAELWGMNNSNDADIDAPEAWDKQTGSTDVLVAIIDTGVDYNHEDLKANMWRNPGETGDGKEDNNIDDDGNGYVDDYRGWNFVFNRDDPMDDHGHGTHVAGTIGAIGNNGKGVVGVSWSVSLMPLKFLDRNGSGQTSGAIMAIIYAADKGADILSNSWGGGGFSQALKDAIEYARDKGSLFVAAAGNDGQNNDKSTNYPSNYDVENVIAIAASDRNDKMAGFSNYGRQQVDLAAPGVNILSCKPRDFYQLLSGTSMATPHVSGAAALLKAEYPNSTYRQLMIRLTGTVDVKSAFASKTSSGGRMNVAKALATGPIVGLVTHLDDTQNTSGPYSISAETVDDGQITEANLMYSVNNGATQTVVMQSSGQDKFQAGIPGQPLETTINYFVEIKDNAGNVANSQNFQFRVTSKPGGGDGKCCGGTAVSLDDSAGKTSQAAMTVANLLMLAALMWGVGRKRKK